MFRVTDRVIFINARELTGRTGEVVGYAEGGNSLIVWLDKPIKPQDEVLYAITIVPACLKLDITFKGK